FLGALLPVVGRPNVLRKAEKQVKNCYESVRASAERGIGARFITPCHCRRPTATCYECYLRLNQAPLGSRGLLRPESRYAGRFSTRLARRLQNPRRRRLDPLERHLQRLRVRGHFERDRFLHVAAFHELPQV